MPTKKPQRALARSSKITARSKRAAARPAAKTKKPAKAAGALTLALDVRKEGLEPILGAAYLFMDRAYASLEGDKKKTLTVTLRPKAGGAADLKALERAFRDELAAQRLRWAVARNNQSVREYVAENAMALAQEFAARASAPAEPAAEVLTAEQRSEIERLIAEVETEISAMNSKKELPDPTGKSLSWEAAQETRKEGPAK
jgi:His-Xaa-Ser system protein HxsD